MEIEMQVKRNGIRTLARARLNFSLICVFSESFVPCDAQNIKKDAALRNGINSQSDQQRLIPWQRAAKILMYVLCGCHFAFCAVEQLTAGPMRSIGLGIQVHHGYASKVALWEHSLI